MRVVKKPEERKAEMVAAASKLFAEQGFVRTSVAEIVSAVLENDAVRLHGVFSLAGRAAEAAVSAPDGVYENLLGGAPVTVSGGRLACTGEPVIFRE